VAQMPFLSQEALDGLGSYAYSGVDKSVLSRFVLNPFWTQFVKLWPLWVAPNTITLTGLSLVLVNVLSLFYFDPSYVGSLSGTPRSVYFCWAICLFLYQTLDAIDGKQARRTNMAGPLGEMFDHGCDALNTTFEVILVGHAMNLGRSWWTIAALGFSLATFYLTTWEEYHTKRLFLGVISGPVEGILMIVLVFIITGLYGPQFWDQHALRLIAVDPDRLPKALRFLSLIKLNKLFLIASGAGLLYNIVTSCANVIGEQRTRNRSFLAPLLRLVPFLLSTALHLLWLLAPFSGPSPIVSSPLILPFMISWGLQFAHQVGRLILAHVTNQPFPIWDPMWIWLAIAAVDINSLAILGREPHLQKSISDIRIAVYITLVVSFLMYARFVVSVITDITNHLGIACFTVRKRDKNGQWAEAKVVDRQKKPLRLD